MVSKKKNCMFHFKKRSEERIGIKLDPKEIARKIQSGKLTFLKRQNPHITKWQMIIDDIPYVIVYNTAQSCVVTVFEDTVELKRRKKEK